MTELTKKPRTRLPGRLCKEGTRLLHAQCWAWGRDIKHPDGNLLLRYGLERLRPPAGVSGCSQYTVLLPGDLTIRLWGFGVYVGHEQGIYMNRYEFLPRVAVLADAWTPDQLARGQRTMDASLLSRLLGWMFSYEMWVEETQGRAYRRSVLLSLSSEPAGSLDLTVEWLGLKETIESTFLKAEAAPSAMQQPCADRR